MAVDIRIDKVKKVFGRDTIIENLSLDIRPGEFFTLLGPSGCGKTTLLRMLIGFNSIEEGNIYVAEKRVNDIPTNHRNMGMVFQNYAIFPHLSVKDNVAFGLKMRKIPAAEREKKVDEILKLVRIDHLKDRMPTQLSGGQQQRVALARAIVIHPEVLLMDEPLSNLDAKLRVEMRNVIKKIQQQIGITTVYVTHDQEEALAVSDRIAVMDHGEIQQVGTPREIYRRPANRFVATFIGQSNLLTGELGPEERAAEPIPCRERQEAEGTAAAHDAADGGAAEACSGAPIYSLRLSEDYRLPLRRLKPGLPPGKVCVSVRPEEFSLHPYTPGAGMKVRVKSSVFLGLATHYFVENEAGEEWVVIQTDRDTAWENGRVLALRADAERINLFTEDGAVSLLREGV